MNRYVLYKPKVIVTYPEPAIGSRWLLNAKGHADNIDIIRGNMKIAPKYCTIYPLHIEVTHKPILGRELPDGYHVGDHDNILWVRANVIVAFSRSTPNPSNLALVSLQGLHECYNHE